MLAENSELAITRRSNGRTEPSHDSNNSLKHKQLEGAILSSSLECVLIVDQEGPILEFNLVPSFSHGSYRHISVAQEAHPAIEIESLPGTGTTLRISLPATEGQIGKRD